MFARLLALVAFVLVGTSAVHAQKLTTFDQGSASVVLPSTFITTERNDGTLRAVFGPGGESRLEIAIRDVEVKDGATDAGVRYVRTEASAKKLRVFEFPSRLVYMQPGADQTIGGRKMYAANWYVGFGNHVAVFSLVAPTAPTPELKQFLQKGLNQALATVRRTAPARPAG